MQLLMSQYVAPLHFGPWMSKPRPAATFVNYVLVCTSNYSFGHALRASRISRQSAHGGGKIVSPMHPREIFLELIYVTGCVDPRAIVRPEGM